MNSFLENLWDDFYQSLIFDKNTSWLPDAEGEIDEDEIDLFEKKYYKVNTEKTGPSGNEEDDFKQNKFYENSIRSYLRWRYS